MEAINKVKAFIAANKKLIAALVAGGLAFAAAFGVEVPGWVISLIGALGIQ